MGDSGDMAPHEGLGDRRTSAPTASAAAIELHVIYPWGKEMDTLAAIILRRSGASQKRRRVAGRHGWVGRGDEGIGR